MDLLGPIVESAGFARIVAGLSTARGTAPPRLRVGGLWGTSCAYFAAALSKKKTDGLLIVTASTELADEFAADFRAFSDFPAMNFPAWDQLPAEEILVNHEIFGDRLAVLRTLLFEREQAERAHKEVVVTSIQALLQPVVPPEELLKSSLELKEREDLSPDELSELLIDQGFERDDVADLPGKFAGRGGIIDIYPYGTNRPVRVEFFDDKVESLREYDPGTQRSLRRVESARIVAIGTDIYKHMSTGADSPSFMVYVPKDWAVLLVEPVEVQARAERMLATEDAARLFSYEKIFRAAVERPLIEASLIRATPGPDATSFDALPADRFSGQVHAVAEEINAYVETSDKVIIFCNNTAEQTRLKDLLKGTPAATAPEIEYTIGHLSHGFQFESGRTAFLAHHEIFHRYHRHRELRRRFRGEVIESFIDLKPKDYVVHITHGIAKYRGLVKFEKAGEMQEFLDLEFADKVRLYVPATKIDLVQKYIGAAGHPTLSKVGGDMWDKRKAAAREAIKNMALDLLEIQAAREKLPGLAFPPDDKMMKEFEEAFIYPETDDQNYAMADIKRDMEMTRPMDRLLCGDVGYGKTELAMRAAFKTVEAGRQVAVLVPTTVLAQQHYQTFRERMGGYPVNIDVLSRFKTKAEQKQTVGLAREGKIDILIGTHRLVSKDVAFSDLGLLVIDEEQRFGVEHKEKLKRLRQLVDVLTMTATPIPRTLHMSLLGIRDISSLETPPQDRLAIQTEIIRFDERFIRDAILHEMNRDGQIFFVHNRVYNIERVALRLHKLIPEAKFIVAHGQMNEHMLEKRMSDFVAGKADILVCTTIIESGLDIPRANTIFINEADRFGLADLHQLRGRVGRYKHRAYCYLILPEERPVTKNSVKRLKALEEYSELGSGFKLAMRDLEIRGAGNILGSEQSGHIAAVGYDLYCRLLEQAVRELRHEVVEEHAEIDLDLGLDAFIPTSYIRSETLKMEAYRRLARTDSVESVRDMETELEDRYGAPPVPVLNLIAKHRLRVRLEPRKYTYAGLRGDHVLLKFESREFAMTGLRFGRGEMRILTDKTAHLVLPHNVRTPDQVVDYLEVVFTE